jgi:sugar/nucleoside kinase (ribokinase family)
MTTERLRQLIASFESKRILVVGDIMLDRFLWGNVSRISPEAPVPVVEVTRESSYPGGAANVARNLVPFCTGVSVLGIAGTGPDAVELLDLLNQQEIDTTAVIKTRRTAPSSRLGSSPRASKSSASIMKNDVNPPPRTSPRCSRNWSPAWAASTPSFWKTTPKA